MKKKNNIKFDLLIILFSALTCFLFFSLLSRETKNYKREKEVKEFILTTTKNNIVKLSNIKEDETKVEKVEKELSLDDYRRKYNNTDIVGILSVKNTKINTLLLQADDNNYYLRRLPNKKKHVTGSVFVDYRTTINKDKNVIIYGHNANNYDIPFRYLRYYLKEDFYKNNKYIDIKTDDGNTRYEIFSVYISDGDYKHLDIKFSSEESFLNHLNYLKSKSIYGTSTSISASDSIITLQTCLLKNDALIVISAKKIL